MYIWLWRVAVIVLVVTGFALPVVAVSIAPDAGSLLRDLGHKKTPLPAKGSALEIPLPPEMKSLGGVRVRVKAFRFAGNHLFSDEQLAPVVQPWLDLSAKSAPHTSEKKSAPVARTPAPALPASAPQPSVVGVVANDLPDFFQVEVVRFNKSNAKIDGTRLPRIVKKLQANSRVHLWISAYSNDQENGFDAIRQYAKLVADYLIRQGVDESRFSLRMAGTNHPLQQENYRAENNRVELKFMVEGEDGFHNVLYFPPNAAHLGASTLQQVNRIADHLMNHPELHLLLTGHTARVRKPDVDDRLSLQRAHFIAAYLQQQGIEPSRITSRGLMDRYPIADNTTVHGRAMNRRVEFYYTSDALTSNRISQKIASKSKPKVEPLSKQKPSKQGLTFADLKNAARAVAKFYRDAGWVIRTYLPRQDISKGVVTIQVVEAKFGGTQVIGKSIVRHSRIKSMIRRAQPIGKPIKTSAIERGTLLTSDLSGMTSSYALTKGKRDRETNLAVSVVDNSRVDGFVRVDNGGTRSTGVGRILSNIGINSPSGAGDKGDLTLMASHGITYWQVQYARPIGADGWHASILGSSLNYRLGKELAALQLKGSAKTWGLNVSYPMIRSRMINLYLSLDLERKLYNNETKGTVVSNFAVDVSEMALYGNIYDEWWGTASTRARISIVRGRVLLTGSPNAAAVAATTRTNGKYVRANLTLSRQQSLGKSRAGYLAFSGQLASKNLDSSEFMTLGGPDGVRAYPVSEGAGGSGWLLKAELRQFLPYHFTLIPFYDVGLIRVNKNNAFTGATAVNSYLLQGAGATLHWDPKSRIGIKATVARRIGQNPARLVNGRDQDGSLQRYRVWADGTWRF